MQLFHGSTFQNLTIDVDGNQYVDCTFDHCQIRFSGKAAPQFISCAFNDCQFSLDGSAAMTIAYLASVYQGLGEGGRALVETLFEEIKGSGQVSIDAAQNG